MPEVLYILFPSWKTEPSQIFTCWLKETLWFTVSCVIIILSQPKLLVKESI